MTKEQIDKGNQILSHLNILKQEAHILEKAITEPDSIKGIHLDVSVSGIENPDNFILLSPGQVTMSTNKPFYHSKDVINDRSIAMIKDCLPVIYQMYKDKIAKLESEFNEL